ncbi:LacI family DNA-binding transcriptional regulator [Saliniramus sp.]|uniref:LacI family DNA-binding transcriptional regulator n=1 Tax=Saliniramus sp. TaxID=2986772 RepID=UPI002D1F9DD3|nr:LacI family DNA-binding transcriptional regulator [Saliniramus sp.]
MSDVWSRSGTSARNAGSLNEPGPESMSNGKRATSIDVARLAGVSQSAVSRTFREGSSVSETTAARVREAAAELGYRPNIIARSFNTGQTKIIGLVVSYLESPFYSILVETLSRRLQEKGLHILVFLAEKPMSKVSSIVDEFLDYQVDAIVTASVSLDDKITRRCEAAGIPIVMLNRSQQGRRVSEVTSDNYSGAHDVARHLAATGRSRIAHIAGWQGASTGVDRTAGFLAGLEACGLAPLAVLCGDYARDKAVAAARTLFREKTRPDAIFVGSDYMAFAVMDYIRFDVGLRIPEDVAVAGYDDVPIASWKSYELTSVRQPIEVMVDKTVAILTAQIAEVAEVSKVKIKNDLVIRRSTAGDASR